MSHQKNNTLFPTPSSPPCAGIQGHKEIISLLPRMPGQAGHDGERGNALFLILIAVALFAALSYAVTQSSRGGAGIDREQEKLNTAVAQQCQASVDQGIMRLKMIGGCATEDISYELADGTNQSSTNPDDTSCFVFHNDGAGVAPCGVYLDSLVPLGTITPGDTTTIAYMPLGFYMRCDSWGGYQNAFCTLGLSTDGSNFVSGGFCYSSSECPSEASCIPYADICSAACDSHWVASSSNFSTGSEIARLHADGTSSSDVSGCDRAMHTIACGCFFPAPIPP